MATRSAAPPGAPAAPPTLDAPVLRFLAAARLGHLATVGSDGAPAVIPICFALDTDADAGAGGTAHAVRLLTPLDAKPKGRPWRELQRVRNLRAEPRVAVVVDRWDEDWRRLGWVHLRGRATLVEGGPDHARGLTLLRAKYAPYREMPLETLPLIVIAIDSVRTWGDLDAPAAG